MAAPPRAAGVSRLSQFTDMIGTTLQALRSRDLPGLSGPTAAENAKRPRRINPRIQQASETRGEGLAIGIT